MPRRQRPVVVPMPAVEEDGFGGEITEDFPGAEEERARFMGDGMRRAEPQEPVWKIVSKGRFLNGNSQTIITAPMAKELDRLKNMLKYKIAQNIVFKSLYTTKTHKKSSDIHITNKINSDIDETKNGNEVTFYYNRNDQRYVLKYEDLSYYDLKNTPENGQDVYEEALRLLAYTGVMTTGLLAAAGAVGVGAWQLGKSKRYWK